MPIQNWGSDSATPLPTVTVRSARPPRTAAATPISTPKTPLSSVANTAMDAVTGSRAIRSDQMLCPSMSETPKLPLAAWPSQVRYCVTSGWSQPRRWFSAATWAGVAPAPAVIAPGLPLEACTRRKLTTLAASTVVTANASRRAR